jgi:response regulator RpfG family c-di-GMP phosphodiesterase
MDSNMSFNVCDEQNKINAMGLEKGIENCRTYYHGSEKRSTESPETRAMGISSSDPVMLPDIDDITFLGLVREYYPDIIRLFLTGQGTLKKAMDSVNYPQIFSYLNNLWSSREFKETFSRAFEPYFLSKEDGRLQSMTPEQNEELSLINANLKNLISEPGIQIQEFIRDGIIMLAAFAEAREDNTGGHIFRIRELTRKICEGLGLASHITEDISFSSMMHDVGKIHIPDSILLKPGPLDDEEHRIMQGHCAAGEGMLGDKPVYGTAREIARSHHERWDGEGYPDGLKGESIPMSARIAAIADAFDALTHERCYKKTWPVRMAVYEMKALSAKQFDPDALDVFLGIKAKA